VIPNIRLPIILLFLACCFLPISLIAAPLETVRNTNDMGAGSLRQAIIDVNPYGEIIFNLPGPTAHTIFVQSELLIDKSLTISGPGSNQLTIDGTGSAIRVITVNDEVVGQSNVVISGLTVDGGLSAINGIFNRENLTVNDITVKGTQDGLVAAGQFSAGALLTVNDSLLTDNTQSGLFVFGAIGAPSEGSTVIINRTTITKNEDFGIINFGTQLDSAVSSTVIINKSTISGQPIAVFNDGGNAPNASGGVVDMRNSTMSGHTNVAFFNNGPGVDGALGPVCRISSSTIADNEVGLIYNDSNIDVLTMEVKNSIIGDNVIDCSIPGGGLAGLGNNLDTDGSCEGFMQVTPAALNLGPLLNNGGPTETHALISPSAAIDIVTDCTFIDEAPVFEDQRGFFRPPVICDAGAFELGAAPVVERNVATISQWGILITALLLGITSLVFYKKTIKSA